MNENQSCQMRLKNWNRDAPNFDIITGLERYTIVGMANDQGY